MSVPVNEIFGPTFQGEGLEVGWSCYFLRLHNCPVHCPGCDTAYTWNGKEKHKHLWDAEKLIAWFTEWHAKYPGAGLVVSGGEPLLYYKNEDLLQFLAVVKSKTWVSVETSGFAGPKGITGDENTTTFARFFQSFSTVHWSPKITPCLHGKWTNEELLVNKDLLLQLASVSRDTTRFALKMVCKDQADIDVVCKFVDDNPLIREIKIPIFLMPYGNNKEEIFVQCDKLVEACSKHGFKLSPRLHSMIWGNVREK